MAGENVYDAKEAIMGTAISVLIDPGCYIPDIHRFMSGVEAFAKRSAVIWFEDSFLETRKQFNQASLFFCTYA